MANCHRKPEEAREGFYPEPQRDQGPVEPRSQTAGLHKPQTTYFGCFKPLSLWYSVTATLGN